MHSLLYVIQQPGDDRSLHRVLQPYDQSNEYYYYWHDYHDTVIEMYQKYGDGQDLESYARGMGYRPAVLGDETRWGHLRNPDAKFDYWLLGGRWSGVFCGLNAIRRRDFDSVIEQARQKQASLVEKLEALDGNHLPDFDIFERGFELAREARNAFRSLPRFRALVESGIGNCAFKVDQMLYTMDREEVIRVTSIQRALPHSILDEGLWLEERKTDNWTDLALARIMSAPEDAVISAVDYHF